MTCSCEFSVWVHQWLSAMGGSGVWMLGVLVLVWWGNRSVRREHFNSLPLRRALVNNLPAIVMFLFAGALLLKVLFWR